MTSIHYWNHDGVYIQAGQAMQGSPAFTAMPMGGVLVAGDFNSKHQGAIFGRGGTDLAWGHDLASKGAVFGLGGDAQNLAIVITDGGPGTITAQWFDTRERAAWISRTTRAAGRTRPRSAHGRSRRTPIQLTPSTMTQPNTCAWRWWPGALR